MHVFSRHYWLILYLLHFQGMEEALDIGVIPTISLTAHTLL